MAEIAPFRALRYNPRLVPDLAEVVTPPYDVISPRAQERYYARHPRNMVRLILPKEAEPDSPGEDRYARAARAFAAWRGEGVLRRDPEPAVYLYELEFAAGGGRRLRRRGLLALMRLHPYEDRVVFPHEQTFARYRDDRLSLMRACPANLEPIFGIYPGPAAPVTALLDRHMSGWPEVDFRDEDDGRHRLWLLGDPAETAGLAGLLRDRPVVIADGHHRYETALNFRAERRARAGIPGEAGPGRPDDFVMANLVHVEDPGLIVLPTHRLVCQPPRVSGAELEAALAAHFHIRHVALDPADVSASLRSALAELGRRGDERAAFAVYPGGEAVWVVELASDACMQELAAAGHSAAYAGFDVAILHRLVIEGILGVRAAGQADEAVRYTRDAEEALAAVRRGEAHVALFLRPPRVAQVVGLALSGERLPQKSTYFFPKVPSGLVINPLNPDSSMP